MSRPIMFEGILWPIMSDDLRTEDMGLFMRLRFDKLMSWPITLVDSSRPIMLVAISRSIIPWFIMSEDLYIEDIWLFLDPMASEVMAMRLPFLSSMSELESMYEVIVVLIRSGSAEGSAS